MPTSSAICTAAPWPSPADLPSEASSYLGEVDEDLAECARRLRQFAAWGSVGGMAAPEVVRLTVIGDAAAHLGMELEELVATVAGNGQCR